MEQKLALLAADDSVELKGFKIAGVVPLRLKYINVRTHIRMCAVKAKIRAVKPEGEEPAYSDFENLELQKSLVPLLVECILIGLLNDRPMSWAIRPFLRRKLYGCGYIHLDTLYSQLYELSSPLPFYRLWMRTAVADNTLLKVDKPSKVS